MPSAPPQNPPPDQAERDRALDASRSILVCAPAGSGKTDLLTRRFLRLLGEVEAPGQIVAITFTKAAAAEMRHRIISELENAAAAGATETSSDPCSMPALAQRALARSRALGWNLLDLPAQLRISTIDSFCRDLALQQPLLSGLGGSLEISEQPAELYRRAARRTLEQIDNGDPPLREAIASLLLWRDNSWQDLEDQLVAMLQKRDQWMHDFVLDRDPDWDALRDQLERPFAREVQDKLVSLSALIDQAPGAREEALELARFACEQTAGACHQELAELAEFPAAPFHSSEALEEARQAHVCLAKLLLTGDGFRKQVNISLGFPKECKAEKMRLLNLIASLAAVPGLESALASVRTLPPARYTGEDWEIVQACFTLLRHAAGELKVVFAEAAAADYIEVAQIAQNVLKSEDGLPTDAALAVADGICHLLVDEFQDTSRRQHQFLARLIAAWPERDGRTCFVVGDPMQSIYFFRDADAELFPRVEQLGLEIPNDLPLRFDPVFLNANFRTAPPLVALINDAFIQIFAVNDGSGVTYAQAQPARAGSSQPGPHLVAEPTPRMQLHLEFMPHSTQANSRGSGSSHKDAVAAQREAAHQKQLEEIVALIRGHLPQMETARAANQKHRVAVLGRTRNVLAPVALALRQAEIPFRAVELENLRERPEIIDALALARALLNPQDRVAWLGVLRAPWCGLSLADLHTLVSAEDPALLARPVPDLLSERIQLLSEEGRPVVERVLRAVEFAERIRSVQPTASPGTWLEQVWLRLGGAQCVDAAARANLDLLWTSLDTLPQGEPDLLGPALGAALDSLTALPDPGAESDCSVQLMTVHKSKGLEFEVVIVPDLQAGTGRGSPNMLSWLERGLPPQPNPDESCNSGEITEFLVAPFQPKGGYRGAAKKWVDRVRRQRESQETRRILYVAATRARDELHFFARPSYKTAQNGSLNLVTPHDTLLATAWPALEDEIRKRFVEWRQDTSQRELEGGEPEETTIESLAASAAVNLHSIPSAVSPTLLRRLPPDFRASHSEPPETAAEFPLLGAGRLYKRHEGGLLSRALGVAAHTLLQELARLRETQQWEQATAALPRIEPRIAAQVRAAGVPPAHAIRIAAQALQIALRAAADPIGKWILSPHAAAASEVRWTGVVNGKLRIVQVDRVFRAGFAPQSVDRSSDNELWWIIDYKTAHEDGLDPAAALPELRRIFAPQIEAYATVLRNLHGQGALVRGGLYYPRMSQFDWWEL